MKKTGCFRLLGTSEEALRRTLWSRRPYDFPATGCGTNNRKSPAGKRLAPSNWQRSRQTSCAAPPTAVNNTVQPLLPMPRQEPAGRTGTSALPTVGARAIAWASPPTCFVLARTRYYLGGDKTTITAGKNLSPTRARQVFPGFHHLTLNCASALSIRKGAWRFAVLASRHPRSQSYDGQPTNCRPAAPRALNG